MDLFNTFNLAHKAANFPQKSEIMALLAEDAQAHERGWMEHKVSCGCLDLNPSNHV